MSSEEAPTPRAPRESWVRVSTGIRLHVEEWGDPLGRPLLVLHGGAQSAATWRGVCRVLGEELRCIVPDMRGHGESDWSEAGDYSCASQVTDLLGLLEALDIDRFALVGHSMGGLNALELAGGQPGRATALMLADVGLDSAKSGMERLRQRSDTRATGTPPEPRESAESVESLEPTNDPEPADDIQRRGVQGEAGAPASANQPRPPFDARLLAHVPTYCGDGAHRRRLLRAAAAPLLILRGEHSRILPRAAAERTAAFGAGELVEISDTGHDIPGQPEATARAILRFLAQEH